MQYLGVIFLTVIKKEFLGVTLTLSYQKSSGGSDATHFRLSASLGDPDAPQGGSG